jgi:hypothetical protein
MEKLIACCGLDCMTCDARIATVKNDDELRKATAEKWKVAYNVPDLTYQKINCTGCLEEGPKLDHCLECEIRKCAGSKGFVTCADCDEMDICSMILPVHKYVPEAKENLKNLN